MSHNCHITDSGIINAHTMTSPNLSGTRVKTVRHHMDRVMVYYVSVPREFLKLHKLVTLVVDIIFVNITPLLITMSHGIYFVTVQHMPSRTSMKLSKSLKGL